MMRAARAMGGPVMAPPQRTTIGDFVGLCLLIEFPDEPGTISRDEVEMFCNYQGYTGFGNNGSVSDYFRDNSIGRCHYTNIVADYYRAKHPKSHYTDPSIQQGVRARQLIIEALTHLQADNFDFTPLTADGSGFVYAMNVYYAGEVANNWAEGLWPHAWNLANPVQVAPGKSVFDYQFTDMSQQLTLGTFCHENGHMLCDYPDLYDYGSESGGAGAYCLMCAGGNINERNPTHISAYLKRLSGWANSMTPIQHNRTITLHAGENEFAIFPKNTREYFIIENRAQSGRDASLPDEGLAVWHVDEDGNNSNEQMTPSQHYELSLEQADGQFRLESSRSIGDSTDLYGQTNKRFADSTIPSSKWWDGTASNLDVFDISAPGAEMIFKTKLFEDGGGSQTVSVESTPGLDIPDNQAAGVADMIVIDQDVKIASIQVRLDISHTYRGDLRVTLLAPWGAAIVLHERNQGGRADDIRRMIDESDIPALGMLRGHSTQGEWSLLIQDLARFDTGTLNRWALEFDATEQPQGPLTLEEAPGTHITDNDPAGIERSLFTVASGNVGSVELSVDITHSWIGDLQISLRSPAGTDVTLHDRTGRGTDDIVKTYTTSNTPALGELAGESISGNWQLRISDRTGKDVGKLNQWRIVIHPAF
ncbi:M6 family metalloprotease domain-containing protein [Azotobacter beijerinckii]|uniref:M6 family metalloprotease domain-containing protein n=2 Tax=Azotobacter beijerinckii TaxID=170623 RepID=A0A1I4ATV4_9GAMM|nr:M6 family metalloprotease domain-containing protein [Azotobacter beijerinckii]SFK59139.1 M6 family metalloprotease domain-containing protein [Azotobacter beijerinckii]